MGAPDRASGQVLARTAIQAASRAPVTAAKCTDAIGTHTSKGTPPKRARRMRRITRRCSFTPGTIWPTPCEPWRSLAPAGADPDVDYPEVVVVRNGDVAILNGFDEAIVRNLKVMDATALTLCRDQKLPISVFSIFKKDALRRVVLGEDEGTLVHV